ncbi:OmpA family protein [Nonlabens ponticola]|uniref:OmpA-like domain-containing protein n=1 Tax=Nonlabens ponticola TaxID=2496866 RepID=A0A3S9MZB2_9FLAO|nr:OmpA family protein [Nonlabens ponticola]AZQ44403.1 hypothetical protein EJ995_09175 [Nonlabens ponticola]
MKRFLFSFLLFAVYLSACIAILNYSLENKILDLDAIKTSDATEITRDQDVSTYKSVIDPEITVNDQEDKVNSVPTTDSLVLDNPDALEQAQGSLATVDVENDDLPYVDDQQTVQVLQGDGYFNITLPDGSNLLECQDYTIVYRNKSKVKIPYSCREYGLAIRAYLRENPQSKLKITTFHDDKESEQIGEARADYIIKLLTGVGIEESSMVAVVKKANLDIAKGYATGGVNLELFDSSIPEVEKNAKFPTNDVDEPINRRKTLLAQKFSSGFQGVYYYGDTRFTSYLSQVKSILRSNPSAQVYVYSYAEKSGDSKENYAVTRDNASTARKLMIQNGIDKTKIEAVAQGEKSSGTSGTNQCIILVVK